MLEIKYDTRKHPVTHKFKIYKLTGEYKNKVFVISKSQVIYKNKTKSEVEEILHILNTPKKS